MTIRNWEKAYHVNCVTPENNCYLQKLLYTVNRIRMSPTPTLNIYLFEGPIVRLKSYRMQHTTVQKVLLHGKLYQQ
jgi:hypothetical protein